MLVSISDTSMHIFRTLHILHQTAGFVYVQIHRIKKNGPLYASQEKETDSQNSKRLSAHLFILEGVSKAGLL